MEVIGEGEDGKSYELSPGPWGEFHPYGFIARQHYDPEFLNGERMAKNTLKHTVHEPITRIFVVEEEIPKRLNIPDDQYRGVLRQAEGLPKVFPPTVHLAARRRDRRPAADIDSNISMRSDSSTTRGWFPTLGGAVRL